MRINPAAYETVAMAGAKAAVSKGITTLYIEDMLGAAIGVAKARGQDTTGAAARLASAVSSATGRAISAASVGSVVDGYAQWETTVIQGTSGILFYSETLNLFIAETDASPD